MAVCYIGYSPMSFHGPFPWQPIAGRADCSWTGGRFMRVLPCNCRPGQLELCYLGGADAKGPTLAT